MSGRAADWSFFFSRAMFWRFYYAPASTNRSLKVLRRVRFSIYSRDVQVLLRVWDQETWCDVGHTFMRQVAFHKTCLHSHMRTVLLRNKDFVQCTFFNPRQHNASAILETRLLLLKFRSSAWLSTSFRYTVNTHGCCPKICERVAIR